MTFKEIMATNPPRLVVQFRYNDKGEQEYQWGIVGTIPVMSLIGAVGRAQHRILDADMGHEEEIDLEDSNGIHSFVLVWREHVSLYRIYMHRDIPTNSLVGMLETIKCVLVGSRLAQHAASEQLPILGPNGQQLKRNQGIVKGM